MLRAPSWVPYPGIYRAHRDRKRLHSILESLIIEARQAPGRRDDLLAHLLEATDPETGKSMNTIDVRNNLMTFITAGHETTALALTWTFYLLSLYPEIEERVRGEIAAVTGGGLVRPNHIDELAYTNQVIQESMRLYPPAALIVRAARRDIVLDGERRAGTTVYVPVYAVHRHEKLWSEPDRFNPSRSLRRLLIDSATCHSALDRGLASDRTSPRRRQLQCWPRFLAHSSSSFGQAIRPSPGCA